MRAAGLYGDSIVLAGVRTAVRPAKLPPPRSNFAHQYQLERELCSLIRLTRERVLKSRSPKLSGRSRISSREEEQLSWTALFPSWPFLASFLQKLTKATLSWLALQGSNPKLAVSGQLSKAAS